MKETIGKGQDFEYLLMDEMGITAICSHYSLMPKPDIYLLRNILLFFLKENEFLF